MLLLDCPWCGPRDEIEFRYGGQAFLRYPESPSDLTDEQWAEYLFVRDNPKGPFTERWMHQSGCRQWFIVVRDTVTNAISGIYRLDELREARADADEVRGDLLDPAVSR